MSGIHEIHFFKMNLLYAIDDHWVPGELNDGTFHPQDDVADGGNVADNLSLHLDVKTFIAALAVRGHDMVTGGGKLVEMSIKCLPVIVSPSCAHSANMRCISYNHTNILAPISQLTWTTEQNLF